jgi:pimeloyl-ACP methyl ester carboxylesterase
MGGYIIFELLRTSRSRVRGLVLMDTRSTPDTPEARRARDAAAVTARERGAAAIAEAMLSKMLAPATLANNPDLVEQVRTTITRTPAAGIIGALSAMRDRPGSDSLLPTLAGIPTMVMVGEADTLTPPDDARAMAQAIPGARLEIVPGAGHLPPLEAPGEVTRRLREFLTSFE